MAHVAIEGDAVVGVFVVAQPGMVGYEEVPDDDPRIEQYLSRGACLREIASLEALQTPRRMREALLTPEGAAWLGALEARIAELRARA